MVKYSKQSISLDVDSRTGRMILRVADYTRLELQFMEVGKVNAGGSIAWFLLDRATQKRVLGGSVSECFALMFGLGMNFDSGRMVITVCQPWECLGFNPNNGVVVSSIPGNRLRFNLTMWQNRTERHYAVCNSLFPSLNGKRWLPEDPDCWYAFCTNDVGLAHVYVYRGEFGRQMKVADMEFGHYAKKDRYVFCRSGQWYEMMLADQLERKVTHANFSYLYS